MPSPIILNVEPEGYSPLARATLEAIADVRESKLTREELLANLPGVFGLIVRLGHRVDEELLAAGPNLRFVATATTGLNHIDLEAAERRGIAVLSLKGEVDFLNTVTATAEHTWALLLALIRHLPQATSHARAGHWNRNPFKGRELSDMTLGIVGYGRLGRIVATYGKAFRMRILATDPKPVSRDEGITYTTLIDLLERSDIISVHACLTAETRGLLGPAEFARIKPGAYLINTARGEIIDEPSLLEALQSNHLAGAAVDVLSDEVPCGATWPVEHLLLNYARTHDNLIITPHIGGATLDSMHKTEIFLAKKIKHFIEAKDEVV